MANNLEFHLSPTQLRFVKSKAQIAHLIGPMGEGKCLRRGTEILMYDGNVKRVEDICIGDTIMGPDSRPRTVVHLGFGFGQLYTVVPFRGAPFTGNGNHILSLKRTGIANSRRGKPTKTNHKGELIDISINDYLHRSKRFQATYKLYRTGVDFPAREVLIDPYWLGLWLGDGNSDKPAITTPDIEVVEYLYRFATGFGIGIRIDELAHNKSDTYAFTNGNQGGIKNPLTKLLREYALVGNKHIPLAYKANSRDTRLRLLAGLCDSDGSRNRNSYQITIKQWRLAEDIAFLSRSLGFAAYVKPVSKSIKKLNFTGTYYQVGISGDLSVVPVRIPRKKCRPRAQEPFKSVLVTGIKEIISEGPGEWFGFTLQEGPHFLLADFTVTHNTYAGVAGMIAHAQRCGTSIRTALIRDTHQNIKTSTIPDIRSYLGTWVEFKDNEKKMIIKSRPRVECDLFGIDDEASISKLQGPQYALIWLEEPAPIYEKSNSGLPREVYNLSLARAARQQGTVMRVQITQNPGDEDHWSMALAEEPGETTIFLPEINDYVTIYKETCWIPRGENKHLSALARAATFMAFKDDPAKMQRYVHGVAAAVYRGKRVTPGYSPAIHRSSEIVPVLEEAPGMMFWDSWLNPTCLIAQYNRFGQLVIHDCLVGDRIGVKELAEGELERLLASPKYKDKITSWRLIGDCTMRNPDQSSSNMSTAKYLEERYNTRFEPGPAHWKTMKESLSHAFSRLLSEGKPAVLLSQSAVLLHRALNGGWHYKIDNSGHVIGDKPVKDDSSHPGDAFANGVAVLMPPVVRQRLKQAKEAQRKKMALSYRTEYHRPAASGVLGM
jgi:hypothetical protein